MLNPRVFFACPSKSSAEQNCGSGTILKKYTWGLDLAGLNGQVNSLDGAGTIGGLLAVQVVGGAVGGGNLNYAYLYDANGNVGQLVDWAHDANDPAGALVAKYEYDPYGNVTAATGDYAAANPFRFSTKYWDDETGLGYWGHRYYNPALGRWISRDPISELGAATVRAVSASQDALSIGRANSRSERQLYAFVGNTPSTSVDAVGLQASQPATPPSANITHFQECSCADVDTIRGAANRACDCIRRASSVLWGDRWKRALSLCGKKYPFFLFTLSPGDGGISEEDAVMARMHLSQAIGRIQIQGCDWGFGIECECDCKDKPENHGGYVYGFGDVHLCPVFFTRSADDMTDVFIHELSHLKANTSDRATSLQKGSAQDFTRAVRGLCDCAAKLDASEPSATSQPR